MSISNKGKTHDIYHGLYATCFASLSMDTPAEPTSVTLVSVSSEALDQFTEYWPGEDRDDKIEAMMINAVYFENERRAGLKRGEAAAAERLQTAEEHREWILDQVADGGNIDRHSVAVCHNNVTTARRDLLLAKAALEVSAPVIPPIEG
jgi:hypothetical protein